MSDDPNIPRHEKWKKLVRVLIHVLYVIIALMFLATALLNVITVPSRHSDLADFYGIIISIFLVIVEIIYFCRLNKPCKTPDFVRRYLGFLTCVVGRGVLYQMLGLHYMIDKRYWGPNVEIVSGIFGTTTWNIGLYLMVIAILARAYNFADWIEDKEEEGELRLESDDDEDIGLLHDQGGLSRI